MGLLKKIKRGVKKTVRKVVPKEVAGIMTAAAPFVAPFSLPAAAALSIGGQLRTGQGRINPFTTALSLAPGLKFDPTKGAGSFIPRGFTRFGQDAGRSDLVGLRSLLFGGPNATGKLGAFGDTAERFLFGSPAEGAFDREAGEFVLERGAKQGLLGFGGEFGTGGSLISNIGEGGAPVISKTKVAAAAAAGLSLAQTQAQIVQEGEEAGLSSGELERLQAEAAEMWQDFDTTAFKPKVAKGGLMRVNRREGNPKPQRGVGSLMPGVIADEILIERDLSKASPESSYNTRDFMIEKFEEKGIAPKILGKGFQGDEEIFVIETPMGGSMLITVEDYLKNFGRVNRREGNPLPPDPTAPVNPFKPKPIGPVLPNKEMADADPMSILNDMAIQLFGKPLNELDDREKEMIMSFMKPGAKQGGLMRSSYALGTKPTKEESGLGGLPIEADMRYTGGFMPYGAKEKADDVPARLSKNEFVFTADAVRAAGGGSVQKGAQKMYNTMKQLESMGKMA